MFCERPGQRSRLFKTERPAKGRFSYRFTNKRSRGAAYRPHFVGRRMRGSLRQPNNSMRVHKLSSQYVMPYEDVKNGDVVTIGDEGELVEGEYGTKLVVKVTLPSGTQKKLSLNPTSVNKLIDAFGVDTKAWIGKEVKVHVVQMTVRDTLRDVMFVTAPDQGID